MSNKSLNIYYQNVRGLRTKTTDFKQSLMCNNFDIIITTETWLCDSIFDRELADNRYDVFRQDRNLKSSNKKTGGGVMTLVRCGLDASRVELDDYIDMEILVITIPARVLSASADLQILTVYLPPDYSRLSSNIDHLINLIKSLHSKNPTNSFLIIGDFNLPSIKWGSNGPNYVKTGTTELQNTGIRLIENLAFLGIQQFNSLTNYVGNTLDLAFSNLYLKITECKYPLSKIDKAHPPLELEILDLSISLNFRKCDFKNLNKYLNDLNWQTILISNTTEGLIDNFYSCIYEAINKYTPLTRSQNNNRIYPVWFTPALINIIKEKSKIHKLWKKFKNIRDYEEFCVLRHRQQKEQQTCYNNYLQKIQISIKQNPKSFWSYIKSNRNTSNYPKTMTLNDNRYEDGQSICDAFNIFFHSVFGDPLADFAASSKDNLTLDSVSHLSVSKSTVENLLTRLDINKGAGSDGIPPLFWRNCAKYLSSPITLIFNMSLKEGVFPTIWKKAHIVPIHKKDSKTKIENYRGISILNTLGKILEKCVYAAIYPVIIKGLPNEQHGFLKNRSTITNLAYFSDYILSNMERSGQIDVIYTDFEKAFDRVDHLILLSKLQQLGIHGDLLRWIKSYLTNRSQAVVVGGYRSNYVNVPTGVPQGSHLGPLLYNSYLYDIKTCFKHANHVMYADDKKVYLKIKNLEDCNLLQSDLNSLYTFYTRNKISVNVKKCQCITFTRKRHPIKFSYKFGGNTIARVNIVRDLGVYFDDKMIFSNHNLMITQKAFKNLGFVIRVCKYFTDIDAIKTVYFAYVRSVLEYASPIWSPIYNIYNDSLERVQKKFLQHILYRSKQFSKSYVEDCHRNNLLCLDERRNVLDMCFLYDIANGHVDCPELVSALSYCAPKRRTRHTPLLFVPCSSRNYSANSVLTRLPRIFNESFKNIDLFAFSKVKFKKKIIEVLKTKNK
ncbi:unnamed protein product [Euphydryas editha]|uniref:Reverse transcriptase domain-containing protein n=1 Tax=Euphydryas editha TaxID=104508 RepID=A0AAU9UG11_EUPED|nr:unnamed protein product [Euphydryas editha]